MLKLTTSQISAAASTAAGVRTPAAPAQLGIHEVTEAVRIALHARRHPAQRFRHVARELRIERVVHLAPVILPTADAGMLPLDVDRGDVRHAAVAIESW